MKENGSILLVSCYELGHQPHAVALPMAFLEREGISAECLDVSVEGMDVEKLSEARLCAISVPMHTALRLGARVARKVREINPDCHICFYGYYAHLNAPYLLQEFADSCMSGEFEKPLVELVKSVMAGDMENNMDGVWTKDKPAKPYLNRLPFPTPSRKNLPPLSKYAHIIRNNVLEPAGYVEASRGCLHTCRHCPIPPVYGGRFFVIPQDVVLSDIRQLVQAGATHITFGDADFLNGPGHSLRIVRAMHDAFPELTFDFTAKVEHVLRYRDTVAEFKALGCAFMISAIESLSDAVLARLQKGHTRDDVLEMVCFLDTISLPIRPSFVPFTPWSTRKDFMDILDFVGSHNLIYQVDPVQFSLRLLIPPGSLLLEEPSVWAHIRGLDQENFTYVWDHPDSAMDELYHRLARLVMKDVEEEKDEAVTFEKIKALAFEVLDMDGVERFLRNVPHLSVGGMKPPRLTESWFC